MKLESLKELFVEELRDIYSAETQILKALPRMANAASTPQLRDAFNDHLEQTKEHIARLETIFDGMDESPKGKVCKAMQGLVEEGAEFMDEEAEPEIRDAGLIAAAQRVEHYEIAAYNTAREYARVLSYHQAERLLHQTLQEEGEMDQKLTTLAVSLINVHAAAR